MHADEEVKKVRYCVTAFIDLLGFSAHLELGANDVRTSIGREAITRLETLENALRLMTAERESCTEEYAQALHSRRINDAIILTIDLPDLLKPGVGETMRNGFSAIDINEHFDVDAYESGEEFSAAFNAKLAKDVADLIKFVGMVARLHSYINRTEASSSFPGAKTVVATGYRRPFFTSDGEDFLAANFSFSNAYLAEKQLHGPHLFLDNNVCQLLSVNRFARNVLRFACWLYRHAQFDPLKEYEDALYLGGNRELGKPLEIALFRKQFYFRELDPTPLEYLQVIPRLSEYLEGEKQPYQKWPWHRTFTAIKNGPDMNSIQNGILPLQGMTFLLHDISQDIRIFSEFIETGTSQILEKRREEDLWRPWVLLPSSEST